MKPHRVRLVLGICVVCAVPAAAAMLGFLAGPALQEREARQVLKIITRLNPPHYDNLPHKDILRIPAAPWFAIPQQLEIYRLRLGGRPAGVVLRAVSTPGYVDPIYIALSLDVSGQLRGVSILEHQETPGIGDVITRPEWLHGMQGRSLHNTTLDAWRMRSHGGSFDQLSGATTSAHAVLSVVRDCLRLYAEQGEHWF